MKKKVINVGLVVACLLFILNLYTYIVSGTIADEYYYNATEALLEKYNIISAISLLGSFVLLSIMIGILINLRKTTDDKK
ncbi:hypothetical protein OKW22_000559 [Bacilli bacterium PM5-3]|nr:hypothetical protein [Bacilli bacterium PM5-3]MDH6603173.1 hypothetical protein [Bacilli bacterium PM5-9]